MKSTLTLTLLFAGLLSHQAISNELVSGPPIDATALASHLNIFAKSLIYRQERPFKSVRYALTYKERSPDGTYSTKVEFLSGTYPSDGASRTEMPIMVFLDNERSTIIAGSFTSHGKGFDLTAPFYTGTPPPFRRGGGYILLTERVEGSRTRTEKDTKGILELELTAFE